MQCFYIAELFYVVSSTLTKMSLLLFFLRIFENPSFRLQIQIVCLIVTSTGIAIFFSLAFQCSPVSGYWTNWSLSAAEKAKCIEQYAVLSAGSALSICEYVIILILPISRLWKLQLSTRKKINVCLMFSMGSGVIVFSFLRLPSLVRVKDHKDLFCKSPLFWIF